MSRDDAEVITRGRPVRLVPTPPGFWLTVLGTCVAALAPLFGFLAGSMISGSQADFWLEPIYWGLFLGVLVGGVGVLMAVLGGRRLWRHSRMDRAEVDPSQEYGG